MDLATELESVLRVPETESELVPDLQVLEMELELELVLELAKELVEDLKA